MATRVERSVFRLLPFPVRLLAHNAGEAGFEPALMLVTPGRLRNANSEKTHHASGWKYFVSAPDSNRLHSVYETDALPNELACDFPPIAWCKLRGPGGRVHPGLY